MPKKPKTSEKKSTLPKRQKRVKASKPAEKSSAAETKEKAVKVRPVTQPRSAALLEPSDEEIQTRAYFIAERRHRLNLEGDSNSDWLEAKRQLMSERGTR